MKLIVGLGNPGSKYAGNRHNIGFMAVDEISRGYKFFPWKKRFQSLSAEGQIGHERCVLLKPNTYMNESGRAVGEAMRFYKIQIGDVIVIHDEIDLPPGKIRLKTGGGNAGHNGLKSITAHVGNDYVRVRLGVGHPGQRDLVADYVLHDFSKTDRDWLDSVLVGVARGMARLVEGGQAPFLSDAARGFAPLPTPVKANGHTISAGVAPTLEALKLPKNSEEPEAAKPDEILPKKETELTGIEAIVAAATRPIAPMPPPLPPQPLPVASREGAAAALTMPAAVTFQATPQSFDETSKDISFVASQEHDYEPLSSPKITQTEQEATHFASETLPQTTEAAHHAELEAAAEETALETGPPYDDSHVASQSYESQHVTAPREELSVDQAQVETVAAETSNVSHSESVHENLVLTQGETDSVESASSAKAPEESPPSMEKQKKASGLGGWFRSRIRGASSSG